MKNKRTVFKNAEDFIDQMSEAFAEFCSNIDDFGFYTYPAVGDMPTFEYEEGITYYFNSRGNALIQRWIERVGKVFDKNYPDHPCDFKPRENNYCKFF